MFVGERGCEVPYSCSPGTKAGGSGRFEELGRDRLLASALPCRADEGRERTANGSVT